jgi:hypothetical protein
MFAHRKTIVRAAILPAVLLAAITLVPAQEEEEKKEKPWTNGTELSWVATSGNTETTSLGFKNNFDYNWTKSKYELRIGFVRAEAPQSDPIAVTDGIQGPFIVDAPLRVTAENYYIRNKYGHTISEKFYWTAGLDWERNRPAGVENRYVAFGGVGNIWWSRDDLKFRTDYSLTYTSQEDVGPKPRDERDFAGARFSWAYLNKFGKVTTYTNDFVLDLDFDETDAWRFNMVQGLAVAMSERLALKVGLEWQYQNRPPMATAEVWLGNPFEDDTATRVPDTTFEYDREKLDTIFTTSLVINF